MVYFIKFLIFIYFVGFIIKWTVEIAKFTIEIEFNEQPFIKPKSPFLFILKRIILIHIKPFFWPYYFPKALKTPLLLFKKYIKDLAHDD